MLTKQLDLHNHSYYSDGADSPEYLLRQARRSKLSLISITDHNSVDHIREEQKSASQTRINLVAGVELSVSCLGRHLHLMGYDFDPGNKALRQLVSRIQKKRRVGISNIIKRLREIGFNIKDSELSELKAEYYGLSHIISCLLKKPREKSRILKEVGSLEVFSIINYYFSPGHEAFVPEDYLPADIALKTLKRANGLAVLAHPGFHLKSSEDRIILALAKLGLNGLEVFTPKHHWDQIVHYEILANRLNLLVTVGSDYHLDIYQNDIPLTTPVGLLRHPPEIFTRFVEALRKNSGFRLKY